jgi:DNA-binding NarL/FixJ family response regulator
MERAARVAELNRKPVEFSLETTLAPIVIIDKRALIRECLARCLRQVSPNELILTFASLNEWLEVGERYSKACAIVLSGGDRPRKKAEIEQDTARLSEGCPVVILADGEDPGYVLEAIDAGAKGFIPTTVTIEVASEALKLIRAGGTFVPASSLLASRALAGKVGSTKARSEGIFTERQSAVVEKLTQGKANKIIAYELNMRESTVKVHIRNIMRKLNATNRTQVAYLYQSMKAA